MSLPTKFKYNLFLLTIAGILATAVGVIIIDQIDRQYLQNWLTEMGFLAPVVYIIFYTLSTLLIFPSTPLNLTGGAIFGVWWGRLWTTIAALIAAIAAFAFTRTIGQQFISHKLAGKWEAIDGEIRQGGLFYMFAIRLLPIITYGLVNFAARMTSIKI